MTTKKTARASDDKVASAFENAKKTLKYLNEVYREYQSKDAVSDEDLLEKTNPSMFEVIQKWYEGASFAEVCKVANQYEGVLIRGIKRLYELLKELAECGEALGNKDLQLRFEEAQSKLYRGIVFAASLYLETDNR